MKTKPDSQPLLAVLGGKPAFEEHLCIGTPNVLNRKRFLQLANEALDNRWLTNFGPLNQKLQNEICRVTGAKYCLAVRNATVGLELVTLALGLSGEVILPSFTFVATAHSLKRAGLTPVFCDVDPISHCLDPNALRSLITPKTSAVLGVHLWGQIGPHADQIQEICREKKLRLVYDAAHAFGCGGPGGTLSRHGDAQVYSFHATKFINTFEGGAITTNSEEVFQKVKQMANFGFAGLDHVTSWGTNAKLNEISAAMGIAEIERMEFLLSANRANHDYYNKTLKVSGLRLNEPRADSNFQYVVAVVEGDKLGLSRDQMLQVLWTENVLARRYFYPACHRMEPYASDKSIKRTPLPNTEKIAAEVLVLPTGETMGAEKIEKVCRIIRTAAQPENARRIREILPATLPLGVPYTPESLREAAQRDLSQPQRMSA